MVENETYWPPVALAREFQEAGEMAVEQQTDFLRQLMAQRFAAPVGVMGPLGTGAATFKTRVQSGGRISIPDVERDALGIREGDTVQTVVIPLNRGGVGDE